eukprot:3648560-Amphidinium_carterae.1
MTIPMLSKEITMSIHTDSSASKAVANGLGLNRKTKRVQLRYLYMQDIIQRGEMTITKVQTPDDTQSSKCVDKASTFSDNKFTSGEALSTNRQPDTSNEQSA